MVHVCINIDIYTHIIIYIYISDTYYIYTYIYIYIYMRVSTAIGDRGSPNSWMVSWKKRLDCRLWKHGTFHQHNRKGKIVMIKTRQGTSFGSVFGTDRTKTSRLFHLG